MIEISQNLKKRREQLVKRHFLASIKSENLRNLEDELQVLREFRKSVLKQKLTLKFELDGVKLPSESQK